MTIAQTNTQTVIAALLAGPEGHTLRQALSAWDALDPERAHIIHMYEHANGETECREHGYTIFDADAAQGEYEIAAAEAGECLDHGRGASSRSCSNGGAG